MTAARAVPRWLAAAMALCGMACDAFSPVASEPRQPPRIQFEAVRYDFGRVDQGAGVTHAFQFRNTGGLDLSIDTVRSGCDCAAPMPAARIVAPGGAGTIAVRCETARRLGAQAHTITVYSNDPGHPVTTLTISGVIAAGLAAEPPDLYVGHLRPGDTAQLGIRLLASDDVSLVGGMVEARGPVIAATLAAGESGSQVRVSIRASAPVGAFREAVSVRTVGPRPHELMIAVIGVVEDGARTDAEPAS